MSTLLLLTACAEYVKTDDSYKMAEENYQQAKSTIAKARSYKLNVSEAESKLSQAADLIDEKNYKESIISSKTATQLASTIIQKYELQQEEIIRGIETDTVIQEKKIREDQNLTAEGNKIQNDQYLTVEESQPQKTEGKKYVVQIGDSLWSIAASRKEFNYDPLLWPIIYSHNQETIDDADLIQQMMTLQIKSIKNKKLLEKARNHAITRGDWSLGSQEENDQNFLQE